MFCNSGRVYKNAVPFGAINHLWQLPHPPKRGCFDSKTNPHLIQSQALCWGSNSPIAVNKASKSASILYA